MAGDVGRSALTTAQVLTAEIITPTLPTFRDVLGPGFDHGDSFEFGLDLIIDVLDRKARAV